MLDMSQVPLLPKRTNKEVIDIRDVYVCTLKLVAPLITDAYQQGFLPRSAFWHRGGRSRHGWVGVGDTGKMDRRCHTGVGGMGGWVSAVSSESEV